VFTRFPSSEHRRTSGQHWAEQRSVNLWELLPEPVDQPPFEGVAYLLVTQKRDQLRRINVVGSFPNEAGVLWLAGSILLEVHVAHRARAAGWGDLEASAIAARRGESAHLMNQQLDDARAAVFKATVEKLGLHLHMGKATVAVRGDEAVSGLTFADGTWLDCGMVIVACGIRPNSELAAYGCLTVGRAIVVDDQMRSIDDQVIDAVGECA